MTLPRYRDWAPTQFDCRGLGCPEQQDWLVAPCSRTRDSGALERSNWAVQHNAFSEIDPDQTDWERQRFIHWGPGWFEVILVKPGTAVADKAASLAKLLSDYPVLNEDHYSNLEYYIDVSTGPNWPSHNEVWKELREQYDWLRTHKLVETDIRLQVEMDGWTLHVGDASYDTDHHGYWGAVSVRVERAVERHEDDIEDYLAELAQDLLDQTQEQWSQDASWAQERLEEMEP